MKTSEHCTQQADDALAFPEDDSFGFAGSIQTAYRHFGKGEIGPDAARRLWAEACRAVADTFRERNPQVIRNFLRSSFGRHLVDEAYNEARPACDEAALAAGLRKALGRTRPCRRRLGGTVERLAWQKAFDEIRRATRAGEWMD